jgi:hypothetical protein
MSNLGVYDEHYEPSIWSFQGSSKSSRSSNLGVYDEHYEPSIWSFWGSSKSSRSSISRPSTHTHTYVLGLLKYAMSPCHFHQIDYLDMRLLKKFKQYEWMTLDSRLSHANIRPFKFPDKTLQRPFAPLVWSSLLLQGWHKRWMELMKISHGYVVPKTWWLRMWKPTIIYSNTFERSHVWIELFEFLSWTHNWYYISK